MKFHHPNAGDGICDDENNNENCDDEGIVVYLYLIQTTALNVNVSRMMMQSAGKMKFQLKLITIIIQNLTMKREYGPTEQQCNIKERSMLLVSSLIG